MKRSHLLSLLISLFLSFGVQAQFTLTLDLHDMDPYIGKDFIVRVTEQGSNEEVGRKTFEITQAEIQDIRLYVFLMNRSYHVDLYVDVNENGAYDAPPTDHAWRRTFMNVTSNRTLSFTPDAIYTDIGLTDPFPYSQYEAVWGGKWMNQTFGSTDSIMATIQVTCDSIIGSFTTKGVFGNPNTVSFEFAEEISNDQSIDSISFSVPPPWTGSVTIINRDIVGDLALAGIGLLFEGSLGSKQILCLYTVENAGNPFANGYFYVRELSTTVNVPQLEIESTTSHITCAGDQNGSIEVTNVEGGVPGYSFMWSTGDTTVMISGLAPGDYAVTVTDEDGCTASLTTTITEPEPLLLEFIKQDVTCGGLCTGSIDITVTGGQAPYMYMWSQCSATEDIMQLCAGEYIVTVIDASGCTITVSVFIEEPEPITIVSNVYDPTCFGLCDGFIELVVTGGIPPYVYEWEGGGITDPVDLCPGIYTVTITDADGCQAAVAIPLVEPEPLVIDNIVITDATNGEANGSIEISVSGGTVPYLYSIDGTAYSTSNVIAGLPPGAYCVYVLDVNSCEIKSDTLIVNNISAVNDLSQHFTWYPNPAGQLIRVETDVAMQVSIFTVDGILLKDEFVPASGEIEVGDLLPGIYVLKFSDGRESVFRKVVKR